MGELTIRRNRGFAAPTRQEAVKPAKQSASTSRSQAVTKETGIAVSEAMRRQIARGSQAANQVRESRRSLQAGEAVLAEIQDSLSRMAELAKKAAGGGEVDREALQAEMDLLQEGIERMVSSALAGGTQLFTDDMQVMPDWLTQAVTQNTMTAAELLAALGLDQTASGPDLLAALANHPVEGSSAAAYLASLYLGAVIAGGGSEKLDPEQALDGLRQLMEKVAQGVPVDEAIEELTGGKFTSMEDFLKQFTDGTAPGVKDFLADLLLASAEAAIPVMPDVSLLDFLSGMDSMSLDLLMGLLQGGQSTEAVPALSPEAVPADGSAANAAADAAAATAPAQDAAPPLTQRFGNVQITGQDLSGVSFDASSGVVTVAGTADVTIQSVVPEPQAIHITGSGTVTLDNVSASAVAVDNPDAHIFSTGENVLGQMQMTEGTQLTLSGSGLLRISAVQGGASNLLRLESGAVVVEGKNGETRGILTVPVIIAGPASLAAQAVNVRSLSGKSLEPMDVVWKTLFPGFTAVTALELNGHQANMSLSSGRHADLIRLWLEKGDLSAHGSPFHSLMIQGKDELGRMKTRYTYLYWNHLTKHFETGSRFPNPFTVTGGEAGLDWVYEEGSHTLRILSGQVTAVSGGAGTDIHQVPFCGRIALADSIGAMALSLGGVVCRVPDGQSFYLGRANTVTLLLENGSSNFFESGAGYAGISLGEGTSLRIGYESSGGKAPTGMLTATGGEGGAGIGRDSGSKEQPGPILLQGAAGLSAKELGDVRSITMAGGAVTANGSKKRLGTEKRWMKRSVSLQMGEYTAILPQFRLSSHVLQLNKLRVSTREYAQAAMMTIDADRHWISQIQAAYGALYSQLDDPVRDAASAATLLEDVRQSIPRPSSQAMRTQSSGEKNHLRQLLWENKQRI